MCYTNLICRLCLLTNNETVSIFTNYDNTRNGYLAHKIMQIANVQVFEGDGLPAYICQACMSRVEGYFQFKIQVEKSDYYLRQQVIHYQTDSLSTPSPAGKSCDSIKDESLPVIKNGVYLTENTWPTNVQEFGSLQSCDTLADAVNIVTPQEVISDALIVQTQSTFVELENQDKDRDKSLLDLTQQDEKDLHHQTSETQTDFENVNSESLLENSVDTNVLIKNVVIEKPPGNYYINNFFNRSDGLDLENARAAKQAENLYNLDQTKKSVEEAPSEQSQILLETGVETNETIQECEDDDDDDEKDNNDEEYVNCDETNETSASENAKESPKGRIHKITYCEKCDKHFEKPISLKKHEALHSKDTHICTYCNKTFRQSWSLQSHIRIHTGERPYGCTICPKTFTDKSALNAHMRVVHFTERTHVCKYCGNAFKLKKQLERHERIHTGHHYHRCELCGKLFTHKSNLMKHLVLHTGEKPYPCMVCNKPFAQKDNLNIHILRHHSDQKPIVCDVCGKVFKNKITLMGHKKSKHSGVVKQIICEICGKAFPDRSCLNSHKWVHNVGTPVLCDVCGKSYPHAKAVRVHKRIVHSELRKYSCSVCGIGFKTSQTLKHHEVVHTGERAFKCEECGKSFGQKTALKTHQRIHTGVEPYSCPQCGESFKWKQTCDKHIIKCVGKSQSEYIIIEDSTNNIMP